jgi:transposase
MNGAGKSIMLLLTEGQMSDHIGAKLLYPGLPEAKTLIADKGYDSDAFRDALQAKGIKACIPPKIHRRKAIMFDKILYKQRYKIENMFGKLRDWRRVSTRYDRCARTFFSAICIAAASYEVGISQLYRRYRPLSVKKQG